MTTATILFAHGSRDPLWRAPMEAVAARMRQRAPLYRVECAYLELCEPSLPSAAASLVANGASRLRVVPMFLGVGKHAREDLPVLMEDLRKAHPGIALELLPAVGEHPALLELLADIALAVPQ